ncbi:MAG: hypothetical protein ACETVZ_00700, partial [Phycisphaerae bacterium]
FALLGIAKWLTIPDKPIRLEDYKKAWFYDLNTGKLFVAESDQIPPIEAPSGPLPNGRPAGVKAYVLSYVYDPNESERFIGFLETTDPKRQSDSSRMVDTNAGSAKQWGKDKLICKVKYKHWVPANSRQGRAIVEEAFIPNENGERPHYCWPK